MTLATVEGYDVTAKNYTHRPVIGQPAFYITGTPDVMSTPLMRATYPSAILINQSSTDQNVIADIYDVETGALTPAQVPNLIRSARVTRLGGNGRRNPGVYVNESNKTAVVNELATAKLTNVPLWVADYSLTVEEAITLLQSSNGPYPIVGYQYNDAGAYDEDVWLESWVNAVSMTGVQYGWAYCRLCKGIFYLPDVKTSRCPTGGLHDGSTSYNYGVSFRANTTS
jgi:hypothetical protein